jgi:hypothetical protein
MGLREHQGKTIIKFVIIALIAVGIIGYALFQARNLINGPKVTISWPHNGATLNHDAVEVKGVAKNIAYITLNDRQIFVDNEGNFNEELLLAPGYNIWKVEAKDKFGRTVSKKIELVLNKPL